MAPGVGVAPAVALARKVDPFGMSEFVAHEIEIGVPACRDRDEPDHLVQGHSPVDDRTLRGAVHVFVHLLSHQPEREGLVAH